MLKANIGYGPWDVLSDGISKTVGITIGVASILVGSVIMVLLIWLKEKVGLGSFLNMLLVGVFMDLILGLGVIPGQEGFIRGVIMLAAGMSVLAFASWLYISSGFGAGPRDSLMVIAVRKTGLPVGVCRSSIELAAVTTGWLLGGMAGVGTIIAAFGIGLFVQICFRLLRFDAAAVRHESLADTWITIQKAVSRE